MRISGVWVLLWGVMELRDYGILLWDHGIMRYCEGIMGTVKPLNLSVLLWILGTVMGLWDCGIMGYSGGVTQANICCGTASDSQMLLVQLMMGKRGKTG